MLCPYIFYFIYKAKSCKLVHIYKKASNGEIQDINAELSSLSKALNKRADLLGIHHDKKFRNLNGMKMMYQNVVYVATNGKQGLSAVSHAIYAVYDMSQKSPDVFEMLLTEFNDRYHGN